MMIGWGGDSCREQEDSTPREWSRGPGAEQSWEVQEHRN